MIHERRWEEGELHKLEYNKHFYIHVANWFDLGGNMKKMSDSPQKQENLCLHIRLFFKWVDEKLLVKSAILLGQLLRVMDLWKVVACETQNGC